MRDRLKKLVYAATFAAMSSIGLAASAGNVGINFTTDRAGSANLVIGEDAGLVSNTFWNNTDQSINGNTGNVVSPLFGGGLINDDAGNPTSLSIEWTTNGAWNSGVSSTSPQDKLLDHYLDDTTTAGNSTFNLTNVPYAGYDVIVYVGSDGDGRTGRGYQTPLGSGPIVDSNGRPTSTVGGLGDQNFTTNTSNGFDGTWDEGSEYIRLNGLSGDRSIHIERISNNVGVHGIQIVESTANPNVDGTPVEVAVDSNVMQLAHYRLDGNGNNDFGHNPLDQTVGAPAYTGGVFGSALSLDGDGSVQQDFLKTSVDATVDIRPTDSAAISVWVNVNDPVGGGEVISLGDHFGIRVNANGTVHWFQDSNPTGNGWTGMTTSATVNDGEWHHLVAQKLPDRLELWIDGVLAPEFASISDPIDYNGLGQMLFVGAHGNGSTGIDFGGMIDEVQVFKGNLTAEQINNLRVTNVIPEPGTIALLGLAGVMLAGRRQRA